MKQGRCSALSILLLSSQQYNIEGWDFASLASLLQIIISGVVFCLQMDTFRLPGVFRAMQVHIVLLGSCCGFLGGPADWASRL